MLKKLSDDLYRFSSGRLAIFGTILMLLFLITVMPGETVKAAAYSTQAGTPDTTAIYSVEKLLGMAEAYGEQGRRAYIQARFSFDLAFPLVYGFFLAVCTSWMLKRLLPPDNFWRRLNLLPPAAVLFDLLENTCAVIVMAAYPTVRPLAAQLAVIFTPIKWLLVTSSFIVLIAAGLLVIYQAINKRISH
jgi:hypothetical protein